MTGKGVLSKFNTTSLEELDQKIQEIQKKNDKEEIFLWFVGAVEGEKSWCSDCVKAEPVIDQFLEDIKLNCDVSVIVCTVDKAPFKSGASPYAKHKAQVKKVPTIVWWGKAERLEEEECMDPELLKLVFHDVLLEA